MMDALEQRCWALIRVWGAKAEERRWAMIKLDQHRDRDEYEANEHEADILESCANGLLAALTGAGNG